MLLLSLLILLGCSKNSSEEVQVQINQPTTPSAQKFVWEVSVSSQNPGGSVSSSGGSYNLYDTFSVTATPISGFIFRDWTYANGSVASTSLTIDITVGSSESLFANFEPAINTFTLTLIESENGQIDGNAGTYNENTEVTLTASPNNGFEFDSWSTGSTDNPLILNINSNLEISANFSEIIYSSNISLNEISGDAKVYIHKRNFFVSDYGVGEPSTLIEQNIISDGESIEYEFESGYYYAVHLEYNFNDLVHYSIDYSTDLQDKKFYARFSPNDLLTYPESFQFLPGDEIPTEINFVLKNKRGWGSVNQGDGEFLIGEIDTSHDESWYSPNAAAWDLNKNHSEQGIFTYATREYDPINYGDMNCIYSYHVKTGDLYRKNCYSDTSINERPGWAHWQVLFLGPPNGIPTRLISVYGDNFGMGQPNRVNFSTYGGQNTIYGSYSFQADWIESYRIPYIDFEGEYGTGIGKFLRDGRYVFMSGTKLILFNKSYNNIIWVPTSGNGVRTEGHQYIKDISTYNQYDGSLGTPGKHFKIFDDFIQVSSNLFVDYNGNKLYNYDVKNDNIYDYYNNDPRYSSNSLDVIQTYPIDTNSYFALHKVTSTGVYNMYGSPESCSVQHLYLTKIQNNSIISATKIKYNDFCNNGDTDLYNSFGGGDIVGINDSEVLLIFSDKIKKVSVLSEN